MHKHFVPTLIAVILLAAGSATAAERPNIVFILTDDMALRDTSVMPKLQSLVAGRGTTFSSYLVNDSLCCPSRSSILRGQFVHDHHTLGNQPPDGGFEKFHGAGNESSTIGTWLKAAGYRTGLMGKYLNGYPNGVAKNYVPPGWDEWAAQAAAGTPNSTTCSTRTAGW